MRLQAVQATASLPSCLRLGAGLRAPPRVAMLVMGDGSARRVLHLHGVPDPQAESYDAGVAAALAAADADRLAGLDPRDGELMVAGRAAWQVLAGAAAGARLRGLLFAAAPLDVGYLVASWAAGPDAAAVLAGEGLAGWHTRQMPLPVITDSLGRPPPGSPACHSGSPRR